ncbi:MAG: exosortase system-associated protein, TIGR04073 family [Nitrosomonas sp.]|nr:exosortase system-associated protein, TIGR04073 family [Nitrosomonas sp.]
MRKMTQLILMLFVLMFASSHAMATERYGYNYISASSEKLLIGLANTATGLGELPKNIILTTQRDTIAHGMTFGVVSGVMHSVARTVIGVFDVVTFWIPTPPSVQPTYVWEDFSVETSY